MDLSTNTKRQKSFNEPMELGVQKPINEKTPSCYDNMTPFILMIALSVHAAFEGLALGVEGDLANTINIVIAILIHKGAAGLSMGISLAKSFDQFGFVAKLLLIFSLATPFGVTVGIIVAKELSDTYEIVFASIAAGSFVYISCSEVIVEEFQITDYKYTKLFVFLLGATIISLLWFLG